MTYNNLAQLFHDPSGLMVQWSDGHVENVASLTRSCDLQSYLMPHGPDQASPFEAPPPLSETSPPTPPPANPKTIEGKKPQSDDDAEIQLKAAQTFLEENRFSESGNDDVYALHERIKMIRNMLNRKNQFSKSDLELQMQIPERFQPAYKQYMMVIDYLKNIQARDKIVIEKEISEATAFFKNTIQYSTLAESTKALSDLDGKQFIFTASSKFNYNVTDFKNICDSIRHTIEIINKLQTLFTTTVDPDCWFTSKDNISNETEIKRIQTCLKSYEPTNFVVGDETKIKNPITQLNGYIDTLVEFVNVLKVRLAVLNYRYVLFYYLHFCKKFKVDVNEFFVNVSFQPIRYGMEQPFTIGSLDTIKMHMNTIVFDFCKIVKEKKPEWCGIENPYTCMKPITDAIKSQI